MSDTLLDYHGLQQYDSKIKAHINAAISGSDELFYIPLDVDDFDQPLPGSTDTAYYELPAAYSKTVLAEQVAAGKQLVISLTGWHGIPGSENGYFVPVHYRGNDQYDAEFFAVEYPQERIDVLEFGIQQVTISGQAKWVATMSMVYPGGSGGTVDQTYNATSANAQSGVAMAGALAGKVDTTQIASDSAAGLVKTNPSESITADADGTLHVGGRIGQFDGTTGLFAPNDREPRQVGNYSFLVTDAKGMSMNANRSLAIVSGYGLTCQSAAAGSTTYRITNNYANRIIAKMAEGGYAAKDEATSTTQQIVRVVSVKINGSTFIPDSTANGSNPIEITVEETLNPDTAITNIRLFGSMQSYATAHIGNGVKTESGGRSLMIGGGISKVGSGNDICVVGNAIYTEGNGNAIFGRNHISRKNRWLIAGTGHDTTNGMSEAGAVVGQHADIKSNTAFAIGNGTSNTDRKNLLEVNTNGQVAVSGTPTANNHLVTKSYVDSVTAGMAVVVEETRTSGDFVVSSNTVLLILDALSDNTTISFTTNVSSAPANYAKYEVWFKTGANVPGITISTSGSAYWKNGVPTFAANTIYRVFMTYLKKSNGTVVGYCYDYESWPLT